MIRQFQLEDAPQCAVLLRSCLQADSSLPPALRNRMLARESPQSIIERAKLFYLAVYESGGKILGMAGLDINEIRLLCVSPEHQHGGIGRALVEHVIGMVPGSLFSDAFVYSAIQSAGFYRACGFADKGPFSLDVEGEALQTIFMSFPLKPM
jgi:N-acetylglutamate synthase-like GNAT family acetyltransferase